MPVLLIGFQDGALPTKFCKQNICRRCNNKYFFTGYDHGILERISLAGKFSFIVTVSDKKHPGNWCSRYHGIPCPCNKKIKAGLEFKGLMRKYAASMQVRESL
jgi:hypothetical protein